MRQVSAKRRFTLGVCYHMMVLLVVSSPIRLLNERLGVMDRGILDRKPISSRNWAAYTDAVVEVLATFQKPEATAC